MELELDRSCAICCPKNGPKKLWGFKIMKKIGLLKGPNYASDAKVEERKPHLKLTLMSDV